MTNNVLHTANQLPDAPAAPSAGSASSAGEASLAPNKNRTTLDADGSATAEEAIEAFSDNVPSREAVSNAPNADYAVSSAADKVQTSAIVAPTASDGSNFRGKQSSNGHKISPWLQASNDDNPSSIKDTLPGPQTVTEQSDGKPAHKPNALDTSNISSSLKGIVFSPSMFLASPETYEPLRGPLRVDNNNSQFDTQSLSENSQSPTEPLRVVNTNSQLNTQSLSEDSLPRRGPLRVVNTVSPIETQTLSDDSSSPDPTGISSTTRTDGASSGPVRREDLDEFKRLVNQDVQALATQLLSAYKEAREIELKKDARIRDLEGQIEILRAASKRFRKISSQQPIGGTPREPQIRTPKEVHASGSRAQSNYIALPAKLRQLAVELMLLRAEVAKFQKDWVTMEYHSTRAIKEAQPLKNIHISAWCDFYRGIAFFGQRKWASADQAFEDARPCVGVHISVATAENWRRKLEAVYQSPLRTTHTPHTPRTPFTPFTTRSTPIDQSLFQGFESMNRIPSQTESPGSVVLSASAVPVILQPPSPLRNRFGAGQRRIYVPRALGSINSNGLGPSPRRGEFHTLQEALNQASVGTLSSDLASPFNIRHGTQFGTYPTIKEEETSPAPLIPVTRRFSLSAGSSPNPAGNEQDHPQRSNSLSMDFKPGSKQIEPSSGLSPSQQPVPAAKSSNPVSSALPLSRLSPIPSSPSRAEPILHTKPPILPSGSSPGRPILPLTGHDSRRAAITFAPAPRREKYLDTPSSGSSLMSPQVIPPDLDDNRKEFSVYTIINSSPEPNKLFSENGFRGATPRDVSSLVRERISVGSAIEAALGLGGEGGKQEEATDASRPPWQDERAAVHQQDANKPDRKESRVIDEGDDKRSAKEAEHKHRDAANEGSDSRNKTQPENSFRREIRKSRKDSDFDGFYDVSTSGSESRNGGKAVNGRGDVDNEKTNKPTQPKIPSRKSRKDPDFDSLYDVSTSESGSRNGAKAGDEKDDVSNNERRNKTQPEIPSRKSRKDSDFDSLYDVSTSGSGSRNGPTAGDERGDVSNERTNKTTQPEIPSRKSRKDPDFDSIYDVSTSGSGSRNGAKVDDERGDVSNEKRNKTTQPEIPSRKSRKDPDFDSIYDVSTSGSRNGANAGDQKSEAGGEGTNGETQSENPFRQVIRKSRKDADFDSLYDVSTSGSESQNDGNQGGEARDEGVDTGNEGANVDK